MTEMSDTRVINPKTVRLNKMKQVNQLLKEIHDSIDGTEDIKVVLYSLRGITVKVEEYMNGGYLDPSYIAEKCHLIEYDTVRLDKIR